MWPGRVEQVIRAMDFGARWWDGEVRRSDSAGLFGESVGWDGGSHGERCGSALLCGAGLELGGLIGRMDGCCREFGAVDVVLIRRVRERSRLKKAQ